MAEGCLQSEVGRILVAGSGFLADAYDLYIIGIVAGWLNELYGDQTAFSKIADPPAVTAATKWNADFGDWIKNASTYGAIGGQLLFGFFADQIGRRRIFLITGTLIILGSVLCGICPFRQVDEDGHKGEGALIWVIICRFFMGFGIGGEYPLSATIAAEGSTARHRGTLMACVFSMQGLGYVVCCIVLMVATTVSDDPQFQWRFGVVMGGVIPAVSMYFRFKMHESEDYTKVQQARENNDQEVQVGPTLRKYAFHAAGTAANWFLLDICFYGNGLFTPVMNAEIFTLHGVTNAHLATVLQSSIIVALQLPGYFLSIAFLNKMGRKNIQMMGYVFMAVFFAICAKGFDKTAAGKWTVASGFPTPLFVLCYGLTFFFSDFGPNTTTYIIPGEIFPSQIKATFHGISAASGKVGAVIGTHIFSQLSADNTPACLLICAAVSVVGLVITIFLTPSYTGDDLDRKGAGDTVGFVPLWWQKTGDQARMLQDDSVSMARA